MSEVDACNSIYKEYVVEWSFVEVNHFQIVGCLNSSLDGRVMTCAIQIHSHARDLVPSNPRTGIRNADHDRSYKEYKITLVEHSS